MVEALDLKLTQSHTDLENKILERLLKAYKEQNTQLETLKQYHEDKIRDVQMSVKRLDAKVEDGFVKNEQFMEVKQTANQLRDKLDDELEIVARNVRESKEKMGEMKKRFEMAMEKVGKIKLEDFAVHRSPVVSP